MPDIDNKIVSMTFDNKKFEDGVSTTLNSLSKLKDSLSFKGDSDGLQKVADDLNKIDAAKAADSIEGLSAKFIALSTIAVTALSKITSKVIDVGIRATKAFTLDPIIGGFNEYQTQMNSVQTILSNTASKGETIRTVNDALDELNIYADKTIYNFSEMTRNIGFFTAAGVGLKDSVASIKGFANVAAMAGANSEDTARAMYQLSQAISNGETKLIDWKSISNAGIATEAFKTALFETGKAMGTLKNVKMDTTFNEWNKAGKGFNQTLSDGWLTSDVMVTTLKAFTGDYNKTQLIAMGYTKKQAEMLSQYAASASGAATNVKTLTQLIDVTKESIGSGWAATWRMVIGDFEYAKTTFSGFNSIISNLVDSFSDRRIKTLGEWADLGGRDKLMMSFLNVGMAVFRVLKSISDAFREAFPRKTGEQLFEMTDKVEKFTHSLILSQNGMKNIKNILSPLFAVLRVGVTIFSSLGKIAFTAISSIITIFTSSGLSSGINLLGSFGSGLTDIILKINEFIAGGVTKLTSGMTSLSKSIGKWLAKPVGLAIKAFSALTGVVSRSAPKVLSSLGNALGPIGRALSGFGDKLIAPFKSLSSVSIPLSSVTEKAEKFGETIVNFAESGIEKLGPIIDKVASAITRFGVVVGRFINSGVSKIMDMFNGSDNSGGGDTKTTKNIKSMTLATEKAEEKTRSFGDVISSIWGKITSIFKRSAEGLSNLGHMMGSVFSTIVSQFSNIGSIFGKSGSDISSILSSISDSFKSAFSDDGVNKISKISGAVAKLVGAIALFKFSKDGFSFNFLGDAAEGLNKSLQEVGKSLKSFSRMMTAKAIREIAVALAILVGSLFALSLINPSKLKQAGVAMGGLMVSIGILMAGLKAMADGNNAIKVGGFLIALAGSIMVLVIAIAVISRMKPEKFSSGMQRISVMVSTLVASILALRYSSSDADKAGKAILLISVSLLFMYGAVKLLGSLDYETLAKGIGSIAIMMAIMVVALNYIKPDSVQEKGLALLTVSVGIFAIAKALEVMSGLGLVGLVASVIALGVILSGIVIALNSLKNPGVMGGAAAILMVSLGLVAVANALKIMDSLGLLGLAASLVALIVVLAAVTAALIALSRFGGPNVLAAGAAVLAISVGLLALANAIAVLAALKFGDMMKGLLGLGIGLAVIGVGLAVLGALGPLVIAGALALFILGAAVALLGGGLNAAATALETFTAAGSKAAKNFKEMILTMVSIIPDAVKAFVVGFVNGIFEGIQTFVDRSGEIVNAVIKIGDAILTGLMNLLPKIVEFVSRLLGSFMQLIRDNAPALIDTGIFVIMSFLRGIDDNIYQIVTTVASIIQKFLQGLADNISVIVEAGANLIVNFLNGIAEKLPEIVGAAFNVVESFALSLTDTIIRRGPELGLKIIEHVVSGLFSNIGKIGEFAKAIPGILGDGIDFVKEQMLGIGGKIIQKIIDGIGSADDLLEKAGEIAKNFASKLIGEIKWWVKEKAKTIGNFLKDIPVIGNFVGDLTNSINKSGLDKIGRSMSKKIASGVDANAVTQKVDTFSDIIARAFSKINDMDEFSPTIRPVVDMTSVKMGLNDMSNLVSATKLGMGIQYTNARSIYGAIDAQQPVIASESTKTISFTQNINSPRELSAKEIYKSTKSQLALAEEEVSKL